MFNIIIEDIIIQSCHLIFLLFLLFDIIFIILFVLSHKISQYTNLVIIMFIEIEAISVSISYLEKIIIKTLFGDTNFFSSFLEGKFNLLLFISSSCIIFSPLNDFINNVSYSSLFCSPTFTFFCNFICSYSFFLFISGCSSIK